MSNQPLLSVICIFYNQAETIESTLSTLYDINDIRVEVIIVDDGSTDESRQVIQSLIDYYNHEETYYFEHDEHLGSGLTLREVMDQVSGSYLWIVHTLEAVDSEMLADALESLRESESLALVQSDSFLLDEFSTEAWTDAILSGESLTGNQDIILNWKMCPPSHRFFNPFLSEFHCLEWILRVSGHPSLLSIGSWYSGSETSEYGIRVGDQAELLFSVLRMTATTEDFNDRLLESLANLTVEIPSHDAAGSATRQSEDIDKLLEQAEALQNEGEIRSALDQVERVLRIDPQNRRARELKIHLFEKRQRYVEAAELKHELKSSETEESSVESPESQAEEPDEIYYSIIIPTTADRKPLLETCLINLNEYGDPDHTELIVVDNASLDDTFEYLNQLQQDHFFHCRVIRNKQNAGFAASVNQGIEEAVGNYICVMHNDVHIRSDLIAGMAALLDNHPDFGLIGPCTQNTLNPEQSLPIDEEMRDEIIEAEYLDSFCLMFRSDLPARFDERYQLAYFEDVDFSLQVRKLDLKLGIAGNLSVEHDYALTTTELGLETEQAAYWENLYRFNEKWGIHPPFPEERLDDDDVTRLLVLEKMMNPVYPEPELMNLFEDWFTSEVKTVVLEKNWDSEKMFGLVRLMMKTGQREVLRTLEDKLEEKDLPERLLRELTQFYFDRNIFSRCRHYIGELDAEPLPFPFRLIELKMAVIEKDIVTAIPLLNELLNEWPAHPGLYKLSGDLHMLEGNTDSAQEFYELAEQLDPFHYSTINNSPGIKTDYDGGND